ncbi:DUF3445 domain containing protein [Pyrenophora teres f. maculata]|nr:DUF3445 domain containing protein [Pyrenophora teres f. maculata]
MALENCPMSSLLELDNTYAARLIERRHVLATERHEALGTTPAGRDAVLEFYKWATNIYLPGRWPSIYILDHANASLKNTITSESLPLHIPHDADLALEILGANIDTEFLFLLPSHTPSSSDQQTYHLSSYINTSPAGFSTRSKLGLSLSAIHGPVPGYAAKLEKSMDRFFARLPVGKVVRRANWSVSMKGEFFCLEGAHGVVGGEEGDEEEGEEVDLKTTFVRCERQTLHRLPVTGAVVFAFKTYMYSLQQLRDEGSGEVLAEAIDGLGLGSVPAMTVYKRQDVWGEKVKAFLRGEIGIDG